jgi:uncharacterized protein YqfA (UPF0365 family)
MNPVMIAVMLVMTVVVLLQIYVLARTLRTAMAARRQGLPLSPLDVMLLELRRIDTRAVVDAHAIAAGAGIHLSLDHLLAWSREGLPVARIATILSLGRKAGMPLDVTGVVDQVRQGRDPLAENSRRLRTTDGIRP